MQITAWSGGIHDLIFVLCFVFVPFTVMIITQMKSIAPLLQHSKTAPQLMDTCCPDHDPALHHTPVRRKEAGPVLHVVNQETEADRDPDLRNGDIYSRKPQPLHGKQRKTQTHVQCQKNSPQQDPLDIN